MLNVEDQSYRANICLSNETWVEQIYRKTC